MVVQAPGAPLAGMPGPAAQAPAVAHATPLAAPTAPQPPRHGGREEERQAAEVEPGAALEAVRDRGLASSSIDIDDHWMHSHSNLINDSS